jgi:hypothetical protein
VVHTLLKRNAKHRWRGKIVENKEIIRLNKNIELKELGSFLQQVKAFTQSKMQMGKYSDTKGAKSGETEKRGIIIEMFHSLMFIF